MQLSETPTERAKSEKFDDPWIFGFYKSNINTQSIEEFKQQMSIILKFQTAYDFWGTFNTIFPEFLDAGNKHTLFLMKDGHIPSWEFYPSGGTFRYMIPSDFPNSLLHETLSQCFSALIAEELFPTHFSSSVVGVSIRPCQKRNKAALTIWMEKGLDNFHQDLETIHLYMLEKFTIETKKKLNSKVVLQHVSPFKCFQKSYKTNVERLTNHVK